MQWVARVKYRDADGKIHSKKRTYPIFQNKAGKEIRPDQTRVIHDLVPHGCTTTNISIRKQ